MSSEETPRENLYTALRSQAFFYSGTLLEVAEECETLAKEIREQDAYTRVAVSTVNILPSSTQGAGVFCRHWACSFAANLGD